MSSFLCRNLKGLGMSLASFSHNPICYNINMTMIQSILNMDYIHSYLAKQSFLPTQIRKVTAEHPIVIVCRKDYFLHFTLCQLFRLHALPCQVKVVSDDQLHYTNRIMIHQLPIIVFENKVVEYVQVADFLADLCLGDNEYIDFTARKTEIKSTIYTWLNIFNFESTEGDFRELRDLGVQSRKDYENLVMQELVNLSVKFMKKGLEQCYRGYSETDSNPQNVLFVDIVTHILRNCPESLPDYYMRAYFPELIQHSAKLQNKIQHSPVFQKMGSHELVLQGSPVEQEPEWAKVTINRNKFMIGLGIMGFLYAKFTEE